MLLGAPGWAIIKIHPPGACIHFPEKIILKEKKRWVRSGNAEDNEDNKVLRVEEVGV